MAYAIVQTNNSNTSSASPYTYTPTSAITAGSLGVLLVHSYSNTVTVTSVTDDKGNTWTLVGHSPDNGVGERVSMYYAYNMAAGATVITITQSSTVGRTTAFTEVSGFSTTDPLASSGTGSGGAADFTFNIATVPANALIIGAISRQNNPPTAGAAYTSAYGTANNFYQLGQYDLDTGAAGTIAFNGTQAASNTWTGIAAAFNFAAGGGGSGGGAAHYYNQRRR